MQSDDTDELLAGLSVMIGTIMEDEVTGAVSRVPSGKDERVQRFGALEQAGADIAMLAAAAAVIVRRRQ